MLLHWYGLNSHFWEDYWRNMKWQTKRLNKANSSSLLCWPSNTCPTITHVQILLFGAAILCVLSTVTMWQFKANCWDQLQVLSKNTSPSGLHYSLDSMTPGLLTCKTSAWQKTLGLRSKCSPTKLANFLYIQSLMSFLPLPQKHSWRRKKPEVTPSSLCCHWKKFY